MFGAGRGQFDKCLEKATSHLLLEPDWTSIMQICDLIRQKDCQPKYAVGAIKKKIYHQNPHVCMFSLQVLESVVKNCGSPVHDEVATKVFMEELRELAKTTQHENVREKIVELIQTWAHAFRRLPTYRAVQDVLNIMRAEGAKFPPLAEADAMFVSDTAPEWADSNTCHRCRTEFGVINRKHHCRACGQVFCGKCSSKTATLPKFGIEKEVRVCDACFERVTKEGVGLDDPEELIIKTGSGQPSLQSAGQNKNSPQRKKTDEELQEEEQLQLALAISQSEAEAKERENRYKTSITSGMPNSANSSHEQDKATDKSSPLKSTAPVIESDDPELSRYLNRTYWENRHTNSKEEETKEETGKSNMINSATIKIAGSSLAPTFANLSQFQPSAPIKENKEKVEPPAEEVDSFVDSLRAQIETFVARMKSNSSRGRLIANDTAVQSLFMNITALHSQLLNFIQTQDNARTYFEGLQDKLSQVKDARAALDALREQHQERLRIKAEEEERAKRYHMAQMLHIKRQQKQEYLEFQRQLTLQRMQEQEREMQMRIEQQKQQLSQQGQFAMYNTSMPGFGPPHHGSEMSHYMPQPGVFIQPPNMPMDQHLGNQAGPGVMQYQGPPLPGQQNQFMPPMTMSGQPMPMPPNHQSGVPQHMQQGPQVLSPPHGAPMPHQTSQQSLGQHPQQNLGQPMQQQQQQPPTNQIPPQQQYFPSQPPPTAVVNPNPVDVAPATTIKEEPSTAELISFD
ncbi:unnamed protein product [Allacma fusca]|uniref:Hepatocyte growth factor-regulated tyrosine kinase substrate n=1 Tax=Allacma fusca TaxID=39272 RepID=A0A8J2P026_9HEXA|nr:unnamed protein product [Allacma fusca]